MFVTTHTEPRVPGWPGDVVDHSAQRSDCPCGGGEPYLSPRRKPDHRVPGPGLSPLTAVSWRLRAVSRHPCRVRFPRIGRSPGVCGALMGERVTAPDPG